jgi:hypothetical protein
MRQELIRKLGELLRLLYGEGKGFEDEDFLPMIQKSSNIAKIGCIQAKCLFIFQVCF